MSYNIMIDYDIYDHFTMEHFRLRQSMILKTSFFLLATVLWRPQNFGRHFLDIQEKCK
jgi:heme A synthase